jgi:hypothetical protein
VRGSETLAKLRWDAQVAATFSRREVDKGGVAA